MSDPSDLRHRLAAALERVEAVVRSREQHAAQQAGVSPLQARVLSTLERRPGLRVSELARELLVTVGTVSAAVSVLEEKGLVVKCSDPEEHRAVVLRLTAKGRRSRGRRTAWTAELFEPVVDDLGTEASGACLEGLLKLLGSMERRGLIDPAAMCYRCEFFRPHGGSGDRPHYCDLLRSSIGAADLQVDCPDFREAPEATRDAHWDAVRSEP